MLRCVTGPNAWVSVSALGTIHAFCSRGSFVQKAGIIVKNQSFWLKDQAHLTLAKS